MTKFACVVNAETASGLCKCLKESLIIIEFVYY
jgi:hypothetical protein